MIPFWRPHLRIEISDVIRGAERPRKLELRRRHRRWTTLALCFSGVRRDAAKTALPTLRVKGGPSPSTVRCQRLRRSSVTRVLASSTGTPPGSSLSAVVSCQALYARPHGSQECRSRHGSVVTMTRGSLPDGSGSFQAKRLQNSRSRTSRLRRKGQKLLRLLVHIVTVEVWPASRSS